MFVVLLIDQAPYHIIIVSEIVLNFMTIYIYLLQYGETIDKLIADILY